MSIPLGELAKLVRSKNAGPFLDYLRYYVCQR